MIKRANMKFSGEGFPGTLQSAAVKMFASSSSFVADESGQDLIEYALVACLLALGAVASMKTIGEKVASSFTNISSTVTSSI